MSSVNAKLESRVRAELSRHRQRPGKHGLGLLQPFSRDGAEGRAAEHRHRSLSAALGFTKPDLPVALLPEVAFARGRARTGAIDRAGPT